MLRCTTIFPYIYTSRRNTLPLCQKQRFWKKAAHDFPTSSYAIAGACLFGAPLEEQLLKDQRRWTPLTLTLSARPTFFCSSLVDSSGRDWNPQFKKTWPLCKQQWSCSYLSMVFYVFDFYAFKIMKKMIEKEFIATALTTKINLQVANQHYRNFQPRLSGRAFRIFDDPWMFWFSSPDFPLGGTLPACLDGVQQGEGVFVNTLGPLTCWKECDFSNVIHGDFLLLHDGETCLIYGA